MATTLVVKVKLQSKGQKGQLGQTHFPTIGKSYQYALEFSLSAPIVHHKQNLIKLIGLKPTPKCKILDLIKGLSIRRCSKNNQNGG